MNCFGGMTAHLTNMALVNFAVPVAALRPLIPRVFEVEMKDGFGYISAVIAHVEALRPWGIPKLLGRDFDAVVYRVPVGYSSISGRRVRGVYFLHSNAGDRVLSIGSFWKDLFKFERANVFLRIARDRMCFSVSGTGRWNIEARFALSATSQHLPSTSRFTALADAKQFLVELFVAFHDDAAKEEVTLVPIRRQAWDIQILSITSGRFDFISNLASSWGQEIILDSVFFVRRVPYVWLPPIREHRAMRPSQDDRAQLLETVRKTRAYWQSRRGECNA